MSVNTSIGYARKWYLAHTEDYLNLHILRRRLTPIWIKGLNSPVMTDSMRNLYMYIPENQFAFYLNLNKVSPSKKKKTKRATAKNKGADQSARPRRLICAFVVRTCIKASFLSSSYEDLNHGSSTSRTTFLLIYQWRTNIHTWSTFLRG